MKSCENCRYRKIDEKSLPCSACIDLGHDLSGLVGMTNADRIRGMTDEELAKWRSRGQCPTWHYHGDYDCMNRSCKDCWLEWLKENDEI